MFLNKGVFTYLKEQEPCEKKIKSLKTAFKGCFEA
jgi:hypothetical protein